MFDSDNTCFELETAKPTLAVLPIGATEQHSLHLPIGMDTLLAREIARRAAERLGAWLLPTLPFSCSGEHREFHGTLWLRADTLARVLEDLTRSLRHQGVRRIVLVNGHGGNWILKPIVRELNLTLSDIKILHSDESAVYAGTGHVEDMHAGHWETSVMLALAPELVRDERPVCVPADGREFLDYVGTRAVSPTGVWGRSGGASKEDGERFLRETVDRIAAYVERTLRRLDELEAGTR